MFDVPVVLYHTIDTKWNKVKLGIKAEDDSWETEILLSENQVKELIRELTEELGVLCVKRNS